MSFNNSMHWRGRAEELRGLAGQMPESVSKQLMRKIAENYECLARTAEQRVNHFPPDLLGEVVPGEVGGDMTARSGPAPLEDDPPSSA